MLTKNDLNAIEKLINGEGVKIRTDTDKEINTLKIDLDSILDKKLNPIKKDIRKIKRDVNEIIDTFDKRDLHINKRMKRIEEHLGLSAS